MLKGIKPEELVWMPRQSFGGLVLESAALLKNKSAQAFKKVGLESMSFARVGILNALEANYKTLTELSTVLGSRQPSLLELLRKMKGEKLVKNSISPEDGRKVLWSCTLKGKQQLVRSRQVLKEVGNEVDSILRRAKITEDELTGVKSLLNAFLNSTKQENESHENT